MALLPQALYGILRQLRIPTAIDLDEAGRLTFRAPLLHLEVDARQIRSIRSNWRCFEELEVELPDRSVRLPRGFVDFDEPLLRLQELQPTIDLRLR